MTHVSGALRIQLIKLLCLVLITVGGCAAQIAAGPALEWSKPIVGEVVVAVDSEGNTYVASSVPQAQHCPTSTLQTPDVCPDVVVTKLDTKGNVVYSTTFGGSAHDILSAIAVDAAGNAYIAGSTDSSDFPLVNPTVPRPPATFGVYHAFVVKLSADGQTVLYSTVYGGSGYDFATSLAVDWTGSAYVAGFTRSVDFPTMSAFQQLTAASALVKSTDAGGTFQPIGRTAAAGTIGIVALDPNSPATLIVAGDHGLLKSTDAGLTWTLIGGDWTNSVGSITVAPGNSSLVIASTLAGLYRSVDGGITWERSNITADPSTAHISSIAFGASGTVYAGSGGGAFIGGVYKSTDSGASWQPTGLIAATPYSQDPSTWVEDLIVDPTNPAVIYAATQGGVMKSFDAGATWVPMYTGLVSHYPPPLQHWIHKLAIDPNHPSILYAYGESLYKSTDGGFAWRLLPNTPWPVSSDLLFSIRSLVIDPQHPGTLYVARDTDYPGDLSGIPSSTGLWKVENDGAAWTNISAVPVAHSPVITSAGDLYVGTAPSNETDGFVFKLDATGSKVLYATYFGGTLKDSINGIAVDYAGEAFITGQTESLDLPLVHPLQSAKSGGTDAFVAKISADGSTLLYSTYLGGQGDDSASGIAIDLNGSLVIAGTTASPDFPTVKAAFSYHGVAPHTDAFVTRLAPDGSSLVYSTHFGGSGDDTADGVALDAGGIAYIAGTTNSPDLPVRDPVQASFAGTFAAALDPAGSLAWATYLGDPQSAAASIAAASTGSVVIGGYPFVAKLDVATSALPPPALPANSVVNGASFRPAAGSGGGIAPGSIVSIFGSYLASGVFIATSQPLPGVLGDTSVFIGGVPAPLFFASPKQINALVPPSLVPGIAAVQVLRGTFLSAKQNVTVVPAAPGLFILNGSVLAFHTGTMRLVSPADPASAGEQIEIFATGLGAKPSVKASLDRHGVGVSSAGLIPGFPGLNQINIKIPGGFSAGSHSLVVSVNGVSSNTGLLWTK